jgi:hypothetical protein
MSLKGQGQHGRISSVLTRPPVPLLCRSPLLLPHATTLRVWLLGLHRTLGV